VRDAQRRRWRAPVEISNHTLATFPDSTKHCLWRLGLIRSPECRLPVTRISQELAEALDHVLQAGYAAR